MKIGVAVIPLLLIMAITFALVVWCELRIVRRLSTNSSDLAICGKCGYAVRGIATLNCPECGSDLREVGIVPPYRPVSRRPLFVLILWTLALPIPAWFLSTLVMMALTAALPIATVNFHTDLELASQSPAAYRWITVRLVGSQHRRAVGSATGYRTNTGSLPPGTSISLIPGYDHAVVEMVLNDGTVSTLDLDVGIGGRHRNTGSAITWPPNEAQLQAYLEAYQTYPHAHAEAVELASLFNALDPNRAVPFSFSAFQVNAFYTNINAPPPPWLVMLCLTFWLFFWLLIPFRHYRLATHPQSDAAYCVPNPAP